MYKQSSWIILMVFFLFACQSENKQGIVINQSSLEQSIITALDYQPNIIWLVAEDMSPYIPAYGDSTITTPNLDRLAAEGICYTNVYTPAAVCAPSRYSLITGRYPSSDGAQHHRTTFGTNLEELGLQNYEVIPPKGVRMYSEIMREHGYYCTNNSKTDYQFYQTVMGWDDSSNAAHWRNRPEGNPFLSVFNFDITHESQFFEAQSTYKMRFYDNFPNPEGKYGWATPTDSTHWLLPDSIKNFPVPPYLPQTEAVINDFKTMYNNLMVMDEQVGIILDQLEEDNLLESTIIIWCTDHGGPLPRQKRSLKDSGIKVPMMIRYPDGRGAGTTDNQLISFIDFAPTLMSWANIQPPAYLQGRAFAGHYENKEKRSYVHAAADRFDNKYDMSRAVKNKRYKYIRNFNLNEPYYLDLRYRNKITTMQELHRLKEEDGLDEIQMQWFSVTKPKEELYDTWNDPHEINDIAHDEAYTKVLAELREECDLWMKKINDKGFMSEEENILSFWPNLIQPKVDSPKIFLTESGYEITCETEGATIGYQLVEEGEELSKTWTIYTEPIKVGNENKRLIAIADRAGWKVSEIKFDLWQNPTIR